ncbi:MAG: trypsin-like peptidase domain-containing protein [Armatimonadetes bacterium]|nr:trypsin-like peptidase domain-containing protein [Armatimonadota bacterium]CUU37788.1 hypothetical protein DCOP10_120238 [Armatimonadetes bacterium DC]
MRTWLIGLTALIITAGATAQESAATPQQKFLEKVAPSIVSVEVVVRYEVSFGEENDTGEQKQTLTGTVLTADGVILVPSIPFSTEWLKQVFGEREGFQMKLTPQSFKVTFAGDTKQYDAELLATDSQLGVGFIKVKELGERTLTPVRFKDTTPRVGEELWALRRKGKTFDYAPYLERVPVTGAITKPRRALILSEASTGVEPGTLLYTPDGEAVGVIILLYDQSAQEEESGGLFGRRSASAFSVYLLPYAEFKPTLDKALERKQ